MGKVTGNWITGAHSGRACRHENIYTKVNKKTGACYSAKLCNPITEFNDTQVKTQGAFSVVSKAVSAWIKTNKESNSADYKKVKQMYDHQNKYATIRGMMLAKGMYTVSSDKQTVTVDVDARTNFKLAFGIESGNGSGSDNGASNGTQLPAGGGGTPTVNPGSGTGSTDDGGGSNYGDD